MFWDFPLNLLRWTILSFCSSIFEDGSDLVQRLIDNQIFESLLFILVDIYIYIYASSYTLYQITILLKSIRVHNQKLLWLTESNTVCLHGFHYSAESNSYVARTPRSLKVRRESDSVMSMPLESQNRWGLISSKPKPQHCFRPWIWGSYEFESWKNSGEIF